MYYTYFVSVITTIEKLFQIKSKVTGLLMSSTEIGQIATSLFLTYYAGRGHRPRWIACGMLNKIGLNILVVLIFFYLMGGFYIGLSVFFCFSKFELLFLTK